jgi:hypothetical protein
VSEAQSGRVDARLPVSMMRVVHAVEAQLEEEVRVVWNQAVRAVQWLAPGAATRLRLQQWTRGLRTQSQPAHSGHVKLPKVTTNSLLIVMVRPTARLHTKLG